MWLAQYAVCWFVWARDSNSNIETFCICITRSNTCHCAACIVPYSQILTYSHKFSQILTDSSTAHAASYLSSSFHVRIALSSPQCVARYHHGTLTSVHSTFEVYPHLSLHYKTRCIFSQILTNYPPLKSPALREIPGVTTALMALTVYTDGLKR
jgi:hypothetical protein